jgi:1-acyl-sn-glycerol-3-phosphate acyltransferase
MLRLGFVIAVFAGGAASLAAIQWCLRMIGSPGHPRISMFFYRILRRLLRLRVRINGTPVTGQPVIFVANHASWVDIAAIGSILPTHFVAKREVRNWPLIGLTAELTGTVFVDRARRQQTAEVNAEIARRLAEGRSVVLFAEGTSSDGNRVLPFRSALVGAASELMSSGSPRANVMLQPLSISYTHIDGLPMGRQHRPRVAWYGDTDFLPHLRDYVRQGAIDAIIAFGEPVPFDGADRKAAARSIESSVRRLTSAALRGRPASSPD